jgi:ABC-type sugar transport system ATPase subunit
VPTSNKIAAFLYLNAKRQKVLLARVVAAKPTFLILDQPTAGVDIGAKNELHQRIGELAREGTAILLISDELDEILELSDRIVVMNNGVVTTEVDSEGMNRSDLLELMSEVRDDGSSVERHIAS